MGEAAGNVAFEGMPEREEVRLHRADGWVTTSLGPRVLFRFDEADTGMRNLATLALCDGGVPGGRGGRAVLVERGLLVQAAGAGSTVGFVSAGPPAG